MQKLSSGVGGSRKRRSDLKSDQKWVEKDNQLRREAGGKCGSKGLLNCSQRPPGSVFRLRKSMERESRLGAQRSNHRAALELHLLSSTLPTKSNDSWRTNTRLLKDLTSKRGELRMRQEERIASFVPRVFMQIPKKALLHEISWKRVFRLDWRCPEWNST